MSNENYFDLNDFKDIVDIDLVEYYQFETDLSSEEGLKLKFFDKDKHIVLPKLNK